MRVEPTSGLKQVEKGQRGYVLALGEVTGHAHVAEGDVTLFEEGGVRRLLPAFLKVE